MPRSGLAPNRNCHPPQPAGWYMCTTPLDAFRHAGSPSSGRTKCATGNFSIVIIFTLLVTTVVIFATHLRVAVLHTFVLNVAFGAEVFNHEFAE